jgi:hypothetical protein
MTLGGRGRVETTERQKGCSGCDGAGGKACIELLVVSGDSRELEVRLAQPALNRLQFTARRVLENITE